MVEKIITVNGAKIWTEISGNGPYLFLASGGPGFCDYLEPVASMIDDLVTVIRFEPRGCGRSEKIPSYDLLSTLRDIHSIKNHFEIDTWIVGGHSWGANIALTYALEYKSQVNAILYIAGIGVQNNKDWWMQFVQNKETIGEKIPQEAYPLNEEVNKIGNDSWYKYIQHPNIWRDIVDMNIPIEVIQGDKDIRPNWPAKQLAYTMKSSKYTEVNGADHILWTSQFDKFRKQIRNAISNLI